MEVLNPATGEVIAEVPRGDGGGRRARRRGGAKALGRLARQDAEGPDGAPAQARRRDRRERRGADAARVAERRQADVDRRATRCRSRPTTCASSPAPRARSRARRRASTSRATRRSSAASRSASSPGSRPWNYPLMMVVWKLGPGARGRQRPDPQAGRADAAHDAPLRRARAGGAPARRAPGVTGDGVPVGDGLVRHPDIALVSLTGDVETGKLIARNAADTLKRVHLELGGKAPMVVLDDADPATVAEAIKIGGYWNSGQDCTASSRILVSERDLRRRARRDEGASSRR